MKRIVTILGAIALLLATGSFADAAPSSDCKPPRCRDITIPLPEEVFVPTPKARVLLPADYNPRRRAGYPVVYLLHGATDDYQSWSRQIDLDSVDGGYDVIFVMPAAGGTNGVAHGWYSDWVDGSVQWETFHTGLLPAYIDENFNTAGAEGRAIAGVSTGGLGAMSYAARHPGTYAAAASLSGLTDTWLEGVGANLYYTSSAVDSGVWGDPNTLYGEDAWRSHNPSDMPWFYEDIQLFLTSGDGTPLKGRNSTDGCGWVGPVYPWCNAESNAALARARFADALRIEGVPFEEWTQAGGTHDWRSWRTAAGWAIPKMLASLRG